LRGKECGTCDEYDPIEDRILLIKLGAPGDVLRTTALLPAIHRKWQRCELTWLTRKNSAPLLENLPEIDRVLFVDEDGVLQIQGEEFDLCLNLDNDPLSSSLATQQRAVRHLGYCLDDRGRIIATTPEGQTWLEMASFDRLKKENTHTYQSHMRKILGLPDVPDPIQIRLRPEEQERVRTRLSALGFGGVKPIAFNTGAGSRWKTKEWPPGHFMELGFLLSPYAKGRILLLGGPAEEEKNRILAMERPDLFVNSGILPLREFMALVGELGLLVTADTLALHVGIGLGVPTVGLFGPTSAVEIEASMIVAVHEPPLLSGRRLIKILSPKDCVHYYAHSCEEKPCCLETISPSLVFEEIRKAGWI
jgi:heptosyltransferase-2